MHVQYREQKGKVNGVKNNGTKDKKNDGMNNDT